MKTLVFVIALGMAAPAAAQLAPTSPDDREQAQALFLDAARHIESGRFADAIGLLRESLDLYPTGATAFNLGVALRGTGDALAAVEHFRALEAGFYGPLVSAQTEQVSALMVEAEAEVGTLEVSACGAARLRVRIDGELQPTSLDCENLRVQVNAGVHYVTASAPDAPTVSQRIEVAGGEVRSVRLLLTPRPTPAVAEAARWYQRPWVWVVVGLAVTGAAVGTGLASSSDPCGAVPADLCI